MSACSNRLRGFGWVLALIPSLVPGCLCSRFTEGSWLCHSQKCLLCRMGTRL